MARIYNIIHIILLILLTNDIFCQAVKDSYSSSSVLSSGKWFRIAIIKEGIYRIDYEDLLQLGLNDPSNPVIYGNNFGQLSFYNDDPKPDDLQEIAIFLSTGTDGVFNQGDHLLFYGQSPERWTYDESSGEYDYSKHHYSDTAFYFITSDLPGNRKITTVEGPEEPALYSSPESDALYIHEKENENLLKSGREWYQPVSALNGIQINPAFNDLVTGEKVNYRIRVLARAPVNTIFRLYEDDEVLKSIQVPGVNMLNTTGTYALITDSVGSSYPLSSSPVYKVDFYNNGEPAARGWLDYVILHGRKHNIFNGSTAIFSDSRAVGPGLITRFIFHTTEATPVIWDITDPVNPDIVTFIRNGNELSFKAATHSLRSYVLFHEENALSPIFKKKPLKNQNLHGSDPSDMVIVTHPLFSEYARAIADLHYENSGLITRIVTPSEIYNEFSGGIPDIAAIRNYLRMKYMRQAGTSQPLKYLLLFGDGSYENKTLPPKNPCFIPTYQSQVSNIVVSSFTSDDFYGLLEDGEGEAEGTEDLGIGRLPVSDTAQAGVVVRKIKRYMASSNTGDWKNKICIIADDEDSNTHMNDAEGLSQIIEDSVPAMNINKIYLDAFKQETSVNGQTYPDAAKAINDQIHSGNLIVNYVGHGNESGLAHERVVKTEDIKSWKNNPKLPLFITATCEFSRFDDIDINIITREMTGRTSAGEHVLLNEKGGGIALMSTTRIVYSAPNYFLNRNIFKYAFKRDSTGKPLRLGDIIRLAKNDSGNGSNKRNFSLLGDPALRLAFPWHGTVITDSVNSIPVHSGTDSLKALSRITISGHMEDNTGMPLSGYSGTLTPVVYDKALSINTLGNDGGQPFTFNMRNNVLFTGKTAVSQGQFRFTFIVPRDIDYSYGKGKISYYAENDNGTDLNGSFSEIIVGGFANIAESDTSGPDIKLFLNDTLFRNGGIIDRNPRILAIIEDEGGINTTGAGIGHDLMGYLDNDPGNSFILNNYFENDFNNYKKGKVVYNLYDLSDGNHTLTVRAWDNFNNSSSESIQFIVEKGGKFILNDLISYPNPVLNGTKISAGHNRPDRVLEVSLSIYDLNGKIIRIIHTSDFSTGYQLAPIIWDGKTEEGARVSKGLYPYRITVKTPDGETASASGRLIIL